MILNLTALGELSPEISWLFHKRPDKLQTFSIASGKVHVFYPEYGPERTTISLLLEMDPVELVRGSEAHIGGTGLLEQYVNDRPWVVSSFMATALAQTLSSALNGVCRDRPDHLETAFSWEIHLPVIPVKKGNEAMLRSFFEPLGYAVDARRLPLDTQFPEWGDSRYYEIYLRNTLRVRDMLAHLYVLIPALDFDKHYFVNESEAQKLLDKGGEWLQQHPAREQIVHRYLLGLRSLTRYIALKMNAVPETSAETETPQPEENAAVKARKQNLHDQRLDMALQKLRESRATSVVDLGCGEGKLLRRLIQEPQFIRIAGMDVSRDSLQRAEDNLGIEKMSQHQRDRIWLVQGSLLYQDDRFQDYEAAALIEVIEHIEPERLPVFEKVIFQHMRPRTLVLTTPNQEYNSVWETLTAGTMRHHDHRFEWTRAEFAAWVQHICTTYAFKADIFPVGDLDPDRGAPSQMAVFTYAD